MSVTAAFGAPEIKDHKALEADGKKYISRVEVGLKQYDPDFQTLQITSRKNLISDINTNINNLIKYTSDENLYGTEDHWANFEEISDSLSGDCEDFALLKYWTLRKLGIPAKSMHILIFYDKIVRIHHAVLVVAKGKDQLVLDNRTDTIIKIEKLTDIAPNMAINENEFFIYGKTKKDVRKWRGTFWE